MYVDPVFGPQLVHQITVTDAVVFGILDEGRLAEDYLGGRMPNCPNCGNELDADYHCGNCGYQGK